MEENMQFTTEVKVRKNVIDINHSQSILLMGSCFVEHIGVKLKESKFDVFINPYGVLYNPMSITDSLEEILKNKKYQQKDLFFYQGLWHSKMHHSMFSNVSADKVLETINYHLDLAYDFLTKADYLIITLGSAWVYYDKESAKVVGNCHKLPENYFIRKLVKVDEIVQEWNRTLDSLLVINPKLEILFTVSPIRHIRDGLHGNQLSKSTLLLAIHKLETQRKNRVHYFPAYEILLDELRDYRFYADDMCHPSELAVDYIWRKFIHYAISVDSQDLISECSKIQKALNHRPFNPESKEHQQFLENLLEKIELLSKRYPNLAFNKEIELCHTQLI